MTNAFLRCLFSMNFKQYTKRNVQSVFLKKKKKLAFFFLVFYLCVVVNYCLFFVILTVFCWALWIIFFKDNIMSSTTFFFKKYYIVKKLVSFKYNRIKKPFWILIKFLWFFQELYLIVYKRCCLALFIVLYFKTVNRK